ncbi:hypothetical protein MKEN_00090200 [Mycena kentingensis (nom. inval.)]|nr:hypothetical protein MKEN_00090200 [Mycena kentingensis (nom. inval.)]
MAIAGLDESVSSFAVHPDYRQVSTFFLGGVFVTSLHCLLASSLVQRFLGFIRGRPALDAERSFVSDKLSARSLDADNRSEARHGYSTTAFFALPLCFLFASVAQFASLLAFPLSADAACAFVVAWGRIPVCAARLIGALIVVFELRKMGVARWEFWVAIVCLIIGIGFIFLNNAIGVGVLTTFAPLNVAYCDRKHFLPASLVSSVLYFSLEVYAIARMILIISSEVNMRKVIVDARVLRPLSLVFLELLTLVPSAVFTNVVAEFVPFSIGAVVVLRAYLYPMASAELLKQIQAGKGLKKTKTNDRSAPVLDGPKGGVNASGGGGGGGGSGGPSLASSGMGGPPQLGGLFAGGMPKLKPAGQAGLAKPPAIGKPPAVPKASPARATPQPPAAAAAPPPPSRAPPSRIVPPPVISPPAVTRPPPSLPSRAAPELPKRNIGSPPTAPPRPVPSLPSRNASPSPSPISRVAPAIPSRSPAVNSPSRTVPPPPTAPGRAPPASAPASKQQWPDSLSDHKQSCSSTSSPKICCSPATYPGPSAIGN